MAHEFEGHFGALQTTGFIGMTVSYSLTRRSWPGRLQIPGHPVAVTQKSARSARSLTRVKPPRHFCGGFPGRLLARIQTDKSGRSQSANWGEYIMQPSIRRFGPAFLAAAVLSVSGTLVLDAVADDSILVVNLAGKFKSCGPDAPPGCEHVMIFGDPQIEAFQKVYRFPKGFVFPKHWHE